MSRYWDDELYHHGIKGQSWGVENGPPYPLNAAGKRKFRERLKARMKQGTEAAKKKISEASRVHKENKAAKKAAKIEEKEQARAEKHRQTLDKLAKSPTALYKNRDAYTTAELKNALDRINTEQKLHEMSIKELNRGKEVLDTIIGYGQTAVKAYSTGRQLKENIGSMFGKDKTKTDDKSGEKKKDKDKDKSDDIITNVKDSDDPLVRRLAKAGGRKALDAAKTGGRKVVDKGKAHNAARKEDKRRYEGWSRQDVRAYKKRRFAGNRNNVWGT